ncbi:MAG: ATP-binding cassette domain-containing protein, partial [Anaerolineae bacterium]|nr:ATP-binding cassette domain-containing protein [Anaerolineae bacterium]
CGKSTLLHLVGGLDRPTEGRVLLDGRDLTSLRDDDLAALRRRRIGFVVQFYNLIPVLTALENAALPLLLDGVKPAEAHRRAAEWLTRLGMGDRLHHRPDQLSGDSSSGWRSPACWSLNPTSSWPMSPRAIWTPAEATRSRLLLRRISSEWGRTILLVTHDPRIAAHAHRILFHEGRPHHRRDAPGGTGEEQAQTLRERMEAL